MTPAQIATQFKPGNPGRPVNVTAYAIRKELDQLGFNWLHEAVQRFRDTSIPNASRDYALGLIVDRVAPKLKAIEVTMGDSNALSQVLINIIAGQPIAPAEPEAIEHDQTPVIEVGDSEVNAPAYAEPVDIADI